LHQRSTSHLYIGEALVELRHLTRQQLELQLDLYKDEVAAFLRDDHTPSEVMRHPIAEYTLGALPRIASRMGRLQMLSRWGPGWSDDPRLEHRRWVAVESEGQISIGIAASKELAEQIASAMLFTDPGLLSYEELSDTLGEFLNLVLASAHEATSEQGGPDPPSPPEQDGFPDTGHALMLLTNRGPGCLVIRTPATEAG
ncbi:MAG: chemotaxis protein CheX, partial [bacterium]|nr:chemotaxis protein CheX [bacterium]